MRELEERSIAGGTRETADARFDHSAWECTMYHQRVANRVLAVIVIALLARIVAAGAPSSVVLVTVIFVVLFLASLLLTHYGRGAEPPAR